MRCSAIACLPSRILRSTLHHVGEQNNSPEVTGSLRHTPELPKRLTDLTPVVIPLQKTADLEYRTTHPSFEVIRHPNGPSNVERLRSDQVPLPANRFVGQNRSRYMLFRALCCSWRIAPRYKGSSGTYCSKSPSIL